MRLKLASCFLAGALVLAACGGDDDDTEASGTSDTTEAADPGAADAPAEAGAGPVQTGSTDLGDVLVNADGLTLYVFTNDTAGVSTCTGDCLATWPMVTVDGDQLPEGLDPAIFSLSAAPDGSQQLAANDQPLYTFSGDAAPGDTNGQGVGGVWFVVGPDGQMIQDAGGAGGGDSGTSSGDTTTTTPPATEDDGGGYDY